MADRPVDPGKKYGEFKVNYVIAIHEKGIDVVIDGIEGNIVIPGKPDLVGLERGMVSGMIGAFAKAFKDMKMFKMGSN